MNDQQLETLWRLGDDVPVDADECIEEEWHIWDIGTSRESIWHWFDAHHSKGVVEGLLNNEN